MRKSLPFWRMRLDESGQIKPGEALPTIYTYNT